MIKSNFSGLMQKFLGFKETPIEKPAPLDQINSKELLPPDLKPFIKKVYNKHFLQYLKTKQPQLNSNDAWLEIKHSIGNYVDETMDSIADALDSYIGWIESDIEDYAEGKSWENADPNLPWNAEQPLEIDRQLIEDTLEGENDYVIQNSEIENPNSSETPDEYLKNLAGDKIEEDKKRDNIDEATQWVEKDEKDKKETLVDWDDVDKAW